MVNILNRYDLLVGAEKATVVDTADEPTPCGSLIVIDPNLKIPDRPICLSMPYITSWVYITDDRAQELEVRIEPTHLSSIIPSPIVSEKKTERGSVPGSGGDISVASIDNLSRAVPEMETL